MSTIAPPATVEARGCIRLHPLVLDRDDRRVYVREREVFLSRVEFDLLELLMDHPRQVLDRQTIVRECWGGYCAPRAVESTVTRLRSKVLHAGGPRIAECVRGYGYRLGIPVPPLLAQ